MTDLPIQFYDLLMLAVLVLSALFGAWKGMAWQLAALASLVVSTLVAIRFGSVLSPYIHVQAPWDYCVAVLILYVAASLVIWLLFRMVADIIDRVQLKEFDHQIGAVFGLAKGVLWCMLLTFFAVNFSDSTRQRVLRSRSGYYAALLVHRGTPLLPEKVRDVLGRYIEQFDRKLDPTELAEPDAVDAEPPLPEGSSPFATWPSRDEPAAIGPDAAGPAGAEFLPYRTARGGAGEWIFSPGSPPPTDPNHPPATDPR
jgi:membrane protein required for colicin V production